MTIKVSRIVIAAAAAFCFTFAGAQEYDYMKRITEHPEQLAGCDYLCPSVNTPLTAAPKGYKAFYISHYGRHGARYAWQSDLYDRINEVLEQADSIDNLTPYGKTYIERFRKLYPEIRYSSGELSRKGWEQQQELGKLMYARFPEVFGKGARTEAKSSPVQRCLMTMASFCLALKECAPQMEVTEKMGRVYLDAVLPQSKDNPNRQEVAKLPVDVGETWHEYIERTIDYKAILGRMFKDTGKSLKAGGEWDFLYYLNYFAHGMASLDTDLDFSDIFTPQECVALWKIDCFQFYSVIWPGHLGYKSIVKDMMDVADSRIASGEKGADLRFGHDTSFLPLLMTLGVNGYDHVCTNGDEIPVWCRLNDVPMGANLQFVFYRPKNARQGREILFKVLLNGEEARLPLPSEGWPYYRWNDFKDYYSKLF